MLADEMGLRKIASTISLMYKRFEQGINLVVCSLYFLRQWKVEFMKVTKDGFQLKFHVYYTLSSKCIVSFEVFHVVLTTYETLPCDSPIVIEKRKNPGLYGNTQCKIELGKQTQVSSFYEVEARVSYALHKIIIRNSKSLRSEHFVLTRTPIVNGLDDIRALFNFSKFPIWPDCTW